MTSAQRTDTETHVEPNKGASEPITQLCLSNDAPIINQLPIELLLQIFECALGSWYYDYSSIYYRHLCRLSRVCARWYSIVQHSSQLWTRVPGVLKEEGLRKVLERSSGKLIDIEYNPARGRYPGGCITTFFDILSSVSGRWRTLILRTDALDDRTREFLQLPAPNIEQLSFEAYQWPGRGLEDVEFLGGNCPNLQNIHISRAKCQWSQAIFQGLESLKLSEVSFDSVAPILDIIRPLIQLKKLEIDDCDISGDVPANTQPVSLPNLQFLRLAFDNDDGVITATEQFLSRISSPPCPLYISLADLEEGDGSFIDTFCEWLFERQAKAVLEAVESFKLDVDFSEYENEGSVKFELLSGTANVKGGFRGSRLDDFRYVMEYIQGVFQRSHASKTFTRLTLSGWGAVLLNHSQILAPFTEFPPITHLELLKPLWSSRDESEDTHNGSALHVASPFSTIKNFILRGMSPDDILDIVLGALGDSQTHTHLISGWRVGNLDNVEIHVEEQELNKVETVVELLRNDSRIGNIDVYVTL
ncbi:hypothetical protein FRC01_003773 [Tulasnella sp. 417]|nr:hypothetical protein FRC01_003773 [Tulasnella sp. 417]